MAAGTTLPRGEKPRGRVASEEQVALYRLLYNADHPLRLHEITAGLPGAYRNDANRWMSRQNEWAAALPEEKWTPELMEQAWEAWVVDQLKIGIINKRFIVNTVQGYSGDAQHAPRDQKVWTANRDKPPIVQVDVTATQNVPWTPSIGAAGQRATARRRFLTQADKLLADSKLDKPVREALTLAQKALTET